MHRLIPLCLLGLLVFTGCGGPYKTAIVTGTVTLGGEPLADASVTFTPETKYADDSVPISVGRTDASGKYTLSLIATDDAGAVVGKHKVTIVRVGADDEEMDVEDESAIELQELPQHDLSFEVKAGSNTADFAL